MVPGRCLGTERKLSNFITLPGPAQAFWTVFVLTVCSGPKGYSAAEAVVEQLQKRHPNAAIIGGVATDADARLLFKLAEVLEYQPTARPHARTRALHHHNTHARTRKCTRTTIRNLHPIRITHGKRHTYTRDTF